MTTHDDEVIRAGLAAQQQQKKGKSKMTIRTKLKHLRKRVSIGLAAVHKLEKVNPKLRGGAAITALAAVTVATANAQSYSTYNYGGTYYGNNNSTFQNQNTGGYTYEGPAARSDNWFIRGIIYTLGGLKATMGASRDPSAPAPIGGGSAVPRQRN